jgi:hypothetical protein
MPDPASSESGTTAEEMRSQFRAARDQIRERIGILGELLDST